MILTKCLLCTTIALKTLDLGTTEIGLHHGEREGNPLMKSSASRVLISSAEVFALYEIDKHLKGKNKTGFRILVTGVMAGIVVNNIKVMVQK